MDRFAEGRARSSRRGAGDVRFSSSGRRQSTREKRGRPKDARRKKSKSLSPSRRQNGGSTRLLRTAEPCFAGLSRARDGEVDARSAETGPTATGERLSSLRPISSFVRRPPPRDERSPPPSSRRSVDARPRFCLHRLARHIGTGLTLFSGPRSHQDGQASFAPSHRAVLPAPHQRVRLFFQKRPDARSFHTNKKMRV